MSGSYDPAEDVIPSVLWSTVLLSERDLAAQVPINFVTRPAVSLTAACFSDDVYDDTRAEKCLSNLLSSRFERLIVDLYWDALSSTFYFCPVSLASIDDESSSTSSTGASSSMSSVTAVSSSSSLAASTINEREKLRARQTTETSLSSSSPSMTTNSPTTTSSSPAIQTSVTAENITLYQIGQYQCSRSLDVSWLVGMIQSFIESTENTLKANMCLLEFSLHAAASASDPQAPAPKPTNLPTSDSFVGTIFSSALSPYMYTPDLLASERSNLNTSWYDVEETRMPISQYLNTETMANGNINTTDGWPNAAYILFALTKRVLLAWGEVDPQMDGYNFSGDSTVFSSGTFDADVAVQATSDGTITKGCLYSADDTDVFSVNASWKSSQLQDDNLQLTSYSSFQPFLDFCRNLTICGISPELNQTLLNQTADASPVPYFNVSQGNSWVWATGEPRNQSSSDDSEQSNFRCALMDITESYHGRWRVEHCDQSYRAACRSSNQPYLWQLSDNTVEFTDSADACPNNSSFSAPRTGLELTYLYNYLLSLSNGTINTKAEHGDSGSGVWVNFNSLDVQGCWTNQGANATCSYSVDKDTTHERTVLVPVIASIVVLAITAVTLFVKCNTNRRMSKRRKRGEGGWDYEGVPS